MQEIRDCQVRQTAQNVHHRAWLANISLSVRMFVCSLRGKCLSKELQIVTFPYIIKYTSFLSPNTASSGHGDAPLHFESQFPRAPAGPFVANSERRLSSDSTLMDLLFVVRCGASVFR